MHNVLSGTGSAGKTRKAYLFECLFEYLVSLLVTDSFLAVLLEYMGLTKAQIGIISSLISLAFLFEILTVFVARKIKNVKRFCVVFHTSSQFFFLSLYLIPFLPIFDEIRLYAVIVCIMIAYFGNYFVTSIIYRWGNSYVATTKHATYGATKEIISLAGGITVTVIFGFIMQRFQQLDNFKGWMIFAAVSMAIFSLCDLICLLLMKNCVNGETAKDREPIPFRQVLKATLGNKNYLNLVILNSIWYMGYYFIAGFMGTLKNALFSLLTVQIINAVASIGRIAMSRPIGKLSDRTSYSTGIALGMGLVILGFSAVIFADQSTAWLVIVCTVLYSVGLAGIGQNMLLISLNYVDNRFFAEANAIKSSIAGIVGFCSALAAGEMFKHIEANGNSFLGISVSPYQVLATIAVCIMAIALLFNIFVVSKQKTLAK